MARITVEIRYSDRPSEQKSFEQDTITIGREAGDIVLRDPQSSSRHAELKVTEADVTLVDVGSTNGTLVGGQRIWNPTPIVVGSEIRIGQCVLLLREHQGAAFGPKGTLMVPAVAAAQAGAHPQQPIGDLPPPSAPPPAVGPPNFAPPPGAPGMPPPGAPWTPGMAPPGAPMGAGPGMPPPGAPPPGAPAMAPPPDVPPPNVPPPSVRPSAAPNIPPPNVPFPSNPPPAGQFPPLVSKPPPAPGPAKDPNSDPIAFLQSCLGDFRPHAAEAIKAVAVYTIPLQLLGALLGYVPLVGGILGALTSLLLMLVSIGFGYGVQGEVALRMTAGLPVSASQVWSIQMGRLVPFFVGIIVPLLVAMVGSVCCLIPGILFGLYVLPVYMVEGLQMLDVNKRSFELLKKNWLLSLLPLVLVALPVFLVLGILIWVFGMIPYVGSVLVALLSAVITSVIGPLGTFIIFRAYVAIRTADEGRSPMDELRAKAG